MLANIPYSVGVGSELGVSLFICNKLFTVKGAVYLLLDNV